MLILFYAPCEGYFQITTKVCENKEVLVSQYSAVQLVAHRHICNPLAFPLDHCLI